LGAAMAVGSVLLMARMPETTTRFALWCIAHLMFQIRMEGLENIPRTGGGLLVANHISYADAVLVGCASRRRTVHFLMWQPIYNLPVMRYFFRKLQAIPIAVESPKSTLRALRSARAELERGELVGIFPEGSVSRSGEMGAFERGLEKVVKGTNAPVIPIYIDGLFGHPLSLKGGALLSCWERAWRPKVSVRIGAAVTLSPGDAASVTDLRRRVLALRADDPAVMRNSAASVSSGRE